MSVRFGLRLAVACLALVSLSKAGLSQTKVAIVSMQQAVLGCAEIKKANAAMVDKYRPRQLEMERLQKELAGIKQQLDTNGDKLTQSAAADLTAQGQRKQRELQRMNDDLQADVTAERNEILGSAGRKMTEIVKKLAEDKGLDVIVDAQSTLFYKPALDLTTDAITAYDKAYPAK
jgi:outer membrane protein